MEEVPEEGGRMTLIGSSTPVREENNDFASSDELEIGGDSGFAPPHTENTNLFLAGIQGNTNRVMIPTGQEVQDESEYVNCAVFFQLVTMLIRNFLLLARIPDGPDLAPSVTGLSQDPEKALSTAGHVSLAVSADSSIVVPLTHSAISSPNSSLMPRETSIEQAHSLSKTLENQQLAAMVEIRQEARGTAARRRRLMIERDVRQNPPANYPLGTLVTLRIPKKNRNATQSRRLLCRILAQDTPGRYQLESEYGILLNTYPAGELDAISATVLFRFKAPATKKKITLNFAAHQVRINLPEIKLGDELLGPEDPPRAPIVLANVLSESVSTTSCTVPKQKSW